MGISENSTVVLVSRRVMLFAVPLLALLVGVGPMVSASAEDKEPATTASGPVTTIDPEIALDDLALMLEPMTKAEVQTEADGWFALLRAKTREISVAELAVRRKNREIAQLEKVKAAAKELAQATSEVKTKQEAGGAGSHEEKTAATERLAAAKEELARKVETANREAAKETEKVVAASSAAGAAPTAPVAEGAPAEARFSPPRPRWPTIRKSCGAQSRPHRRSQRKPEVRRQSRRLLQSLKRTPQ